MEWLKKLMGQGKDAAGGAAGKAGDAADKVGLDTAAEKTMDVAGDVDDKVGDVAGDVVDKGKDVVGGGRDD